jgi:hypothetical protein
MVSPLPAAWTTAPRDSKLAIVVAAVDTREDAIDASPDVERIAHDLVETARAPLESGAQRALKRQEKADGRG